MTMADANAREYREDALSVEVDRVLPPSTARTRGVVRPPGATSRERVVDDPPVSGAAAHSANRELTKASPPPAAALRAVARVYVLALALIALLAGAGRVEAQDASRRAAEETIATAPVEIDGAVLFEVRGVASYPAEVRARSVNERIVAVAADRTMLCNIGVECSVRQVRSRTPSMRPDIGSRIGAPEHEYG